MCGDVCCPSCGPAQGNYRCPCCRNWVSEGCECTQEQLEAAEQAEADADQAYADEVREHDSGCADYWNW